MSTENTRRSAQRNKRGKYVTRACLQCQRRKTKCDGNNPCTSCTTHGRTCLSQGYNKVSADSGRAVHSSNSIATLQTRDTTSQVANKELHDRLANMERLLATYMRNEKLHTDESDCNDESIDQLTNVDVTAPTQEILPRRNSGMAMADILVGKVIDQEAYYDYDIERTTTPRGFMDVNSGIQRHGNTIICVEQSSKLWLKALVLSYGVLPNEDLGSRLLQSYFDNVHNLYPYIHAPHVWKTFNWIWKRHLLVSMDDVTSEDESMSSLGLMFLCIANGLLVTSIDGVEPGLRVPMCQNLYALGTYFIRELLDPSCPNPRPRLIHIQVMLQMVIYQFNLSVHHVAEALLAVAIAQCHVLGLQSHRMGEGLPVFEAEISRRTWWTFFVLDHKLSLESGHPCFIDHTKVDIQHPLNLSDDFLELHQYRREPSSQLQDRIDSELDSNSATSVHYLKAAIAYSKVTEDVWKLLFVHGMSGKLNAGLLDNQLEMLVEEVRTTRPCYLTYNPHMTFQEQYCNVGWPRIHQSLDLHFQYLVLKMSIHSLLNGEYDSQGTVNSSEQEVGDKCGQLASIVITIFRDIPDEYHNYRLPLTRYVLVATSVLIASVRKFPQSTRTYHFPITLAMQALERINENLYSGGRMSRMISHLQAGVKLLYPFLSISSVLRNDFYPMSWDHTLGPSSAQGEKSFKGDKSSQIGSSIWYNNPGCHEAQPLDEFGLMTGVRVQPSLSSERISDKALVAKRDTLYRRPDGPVDKSNNHGPRAAMNQDLAAQLELLGEAATLDCISQQSSSTQLPDSSTVFSHESNHQFTDSCNQISGQSNTRTGLIRPPEPVADTTMKSAQQTQLGNLDYLLF